MVTILQCNETLGNLEEIAIWLIGSEVHIENEVCISRNFLFRRNNLERVLYKLACCFVQDL